MKMNKFSLNLLIVFCAIIIPKKIKALLTSNVGVIPTMKFEAMYQFGDSLSDTGNLVLEPNGRDVNFARLPYGTTYFHRATGRCSDGLLMVDFFDCRRRMQKSLVIMGEIGGNDYNFAFFHGQTVQEVYALVPQVIHSIKNAILEVVKLGAKNIVVPGNFPIGCVPIYLVQFRTNDASKYDELHCLKEYNDFSKYHNQLLNEAIQQVQVQYPSVAIAYADSYSALTWLLRHAPSLGFEKANPEKACCAEGHNPYNYDTGRACGSPGVPVCPDPTKRVNWDGIHMTQQGNKYVAIWLLRHFIPKLLRHPLHL
ncbi:hypothetical protein RND81_05G016600 [Saponaria officinalis]|uniref:Uncharacterized protein n=1 Tax=Saponaria officinalis TaxID=3572 RepID=A0AAW1KTA3_SAPOF